VGRGEPRWSHRLAPAQALSRFDASFVRPVIAGLHCMIYRLVPWPTLRFAKYKGDAGRQTASDEKLVSFSGSL